MDSKISSRKEMFIKGAKSYLDALTAIAAFQDEVQGMCKEIFEHRAPDFAAQMGLEAEDCELFAENDADEGWAEIGISRSAQQDCYFCMYLAWGEGEQANDAIAATLSLDLYHKRLRDEIYDSFRKTPGCRVKKFDTYSLVLSQELKDHASASEILDALALEWIDYCRSAGGLKLAKRT